MKSDIDRWNDKYAGREISREISPDPILLQNEHLFKNRGNALDVACGVGDSALFLARAGCVSFAVDGSHVGIRHAKQRARWNNLEIHAYVADLDHCALPDGVFDVMVVIRYLNRGIIDVLKDALAPDGVMVYKTFNRNFLACKPGFSPDYVLKNGELRNWFSGWECHASNDDENNTENQTYWIGVKTNGGV